MMFQKIGKWIIRFTLVNVLVSILFLSTSLIEWVERNVYSFVFGQLLIDLDTIILYIAPAVEMVLMLLYVILTIVLRRNREFNMQMVIYSLLILLFLLSSYIHLVVNYAE
jgi:hypothetical protein